MAKQRVSRTELQALVLAQARASGKLAELADVTITGPLNGRNPNWGFRPWPADNAVLSPDGAEALNEIVSRLQSSYELAGG
jgi:hypothetical protein